MKEKKIDLLIILVSLCWIIYSCLIDNALLNKIGYIVTGFIMVTLLPMAFRMTSSTYKVLRLEAMRYGFVCMLSVLTGLKITEILTKKEFTVDIDPLDVVLFGVFLQSCYFLIKKYILSKRK